MSKKGFSGKARSIKGKIIDPNIKDLQTSLSQKTGMNVSIDNKKSNKGRISFDYQNMDQLNRLISIIRDRY